MTRAAALGVLAFAFAAPVYAQGWNCSVNAELSPNLPARMETLVDSQGGRSTVDFYIYWIPQTGAVALQQMAWTAIPREATLLWKPERIEFSIPGRRTDRRGFVHLYGPSGLNLNVRPGTIRSLRPTFDASWVKIEDGHVIAQWWSGTPRRADHVDRRGRTLGSVELALPMAADAQALFSRMRAELEGKATDPATHCTALPARSDDEL